MRSLFKKQKNEAEFQNSKQNIMVDIWQKYYLIIQDKWAKKMSSITANLSKSSLTYFFFLFLTVSACLNIYIILKGFSNSTSDSIKVVPLSKSININKKLFILKPTQGLVSEKELKRILLFRSYLDSLEKTPFGRQSYDSISHYRPGLIDSLVFIENYYKTNIKD